MSPTELHVLRAKREYHLAEATLLGEQIAAEMRRRAESQIDLSRPRAAWKRGQRLSEEGERAILAAYDQYMRPADVARLFEISGTAANNWQRRWRERRRHPQ